MQDSYSDHTLNRNNPQNWYMGYRIISDQIDKEGLRVVCDNLQSVIDKGIPGAVVEFGCYAGTTSLFMRRILDKSEQSNKREFHVYDSFAGLPPKRTQDISAAGVDFEAGKLYATKKELIRQFQSAGLRSPTIHKAWFNELTAQDVPAPIAFAFLDGDFYDSILSGLRLVAPHMSKSGRILIDDYKREALPGVERAINDFFHNKPLSLSSTQGIAIITTS